MISLIQYLDFENVSKFYESIDPVFEAINKILGASCGILVLREDFDSFIEVAVNGYSSDFYYSFLIRGKGEFEKIASTNEPVFFLSNKYPLYEKNSIYAVTNRIYYKQEMLGFLLLEFPSEVSLLQKEFLQLVAERISYIHSLKLNLIPSASSSHFTDKEKNINFELFDFLLGNFSEYANNFKIYRFMSIQGSIGAGKKSYVKYFTKKLDLQGKSVYLNSLPEQIIKLEKSIRDWIDIATNGAIVIENTSSLTMGQQRVFFELMKDSTFNLKIVFLDDLTKHQEDYQPFWNLLSQNTIQLPNILKLEKEKLRTLIELFFQYLKEFHRRPDMTISEDAFDFLLNYPYKENLRDLRNLLEQPIINSKENEIKKEFYLKINNSKIKGLDFQNEEDLDLRKSVQALERQKILLANKIFSGNQIRMAKALGISRGSLQYKMKQLEL